MAKSKKPPAEDPAPAKPAAETKSASKKSKVPGEVIGNPKTGIVPALPA